MERIMFTLWIFSLYTLTTISSSILTRNLTMAVNTTTEGNTTSAATTTGANISIAATSAIATSVATTTEAPTTVMQSTANQNTTQTSDLGTTTTTTPNATKRDRSTTTETATVTTTTTTSVATTTEAPTAVIQSTTNQKNTQTSVLGTTTTTTRKATTEDPSTVTKNSDLQLCSSSNSNLCKNSGTCYQDVLTSKFRFCKCPDGFHGNECESEVAEDLKIYLIIVGLLALLFLVISVITSCKLYIKSGDIKNIEEEKNDLELQYQRRINTSRTSTFNDSKSQGTTSDQGSICEEHHSFSYNNRGLDHSTHALNVPMITATKRPDNDHIDSSAIDIDLAEQDYERKPRSISMLSEYSYLGIPKMSATVLDADTNSVHSGSALIPPAKKQNQRPKSWAGVLETDDDAHSEKSGQLFIPRGYRDSGLYSDSGDEFFRQNKQFFKQPSVDGRGYVIDQYSRTSSIDRRYPPKYAQRSRKNLTDQRHKARSLQDLRVIAMNSSRANSDTESVSYVQNIHTGQITKANPRRYIPPQKIHKPKGIHARSAAEKQFY